jgi:hypothetical protein
MIIKIKSSEIYFTFSSKNDQKRRFLLKKRKKTLIYEGFFDF